MENSINEEYKLEQVRKKVKEMRGFYKHLAAYLFVNIFFWAIQIINMKPQDSFFKWGTFATAFFWGIGLFFHWYSVFGLGINVVFGKDWEQRKIKQLMEKEKNRKWE